MLTQLHKRELGVAFSRHTQPAWFRITKWIVFLGGARWLYRRHAQHPDVFWRWVTGVPLAGLLLHSVYRYKTRGWTQPWGGWNDVAAADGKRFAIHAPEPSTQAMHFNAALWSNGPKK